MHFGENPDEPVLNKRYINGYNHLQMAKTKKCPICKSDLVGRADMKFCSRECKNSYHSRLRKATTDATTRIDRILHRNRSILLEIMGKNTKQKKVDRMLLDLKNFNYDYVTGYHLNSRNKIVNYVYDFSWVIFSTLEVSITRRRS